MKFIDANVFLFAALDTGPRGEQARALLREVRPGSPAATTALVLNEVLWNLRKPAGREKAIEESRRLAGIPGLHVLPIGLSQWNRALDLMTKHGHLKPNDAVHAASALEAGISAIVSTDPDFDSVAGLKRQDLG